MKMVKEHIVHDRFSDRFGHAGAAVEITVREDAPHDLRYAIPLIAKSVGLNPKEIREVVCGVLLVPPDRNNWSDEPVSREVDDLIGSCDWFKVYDILEAIHAYLWRGHADQMQPFGSRVNQYLREHGIGWQLTDGVIEYRGSEAFTASTRQASDVFAIRGQTAAANEVHEALRDISRRPSPDITGAIQHVVAALEAVARDVAGEPNLTLGRLIPRLNLAPPLDTAVDKLWGFASDRARHIREGQTVTTDEAELMVGIACTLCTFLIRRSSGDRPQNLGW